MHPIRVGVPIQPIHGDVSHRIVTVYITVYPARRALHNPAAEHRISHPWTTDRHQRNSWIGNPADCQCCYSPAQAVTGETDFGGRVRRAKSGDTAGHDLPYAVQRPLKSAMHQTSLAMHQIRKKMERMQMPGGDRVVFLWNRYDVGVSRRIRRIVALGSPKRQYREASVVSEESLCPSPTGPIADQLVMSE